MAPGRFRHTDAAASICCAFAASSFGSLDTSSTRASRASARAWPGVASADADSAFASCDFVVEAVIEDIALKVVLYPRTSGIPQPCAGGAAAEQLLCAATASRDGRARCSANQTWRILPLTVERLKNITSYAFLSSL